MADLLNELSAINTVVDILSPLSKAEQRRALVWLEDYFDVFSEYGEGEDIAIAFADSASDNAALVSSGFESGIEEKPDTFETLYNTVGPKTAIQKISCAAYWLETRENHESWKSFEVNKLLKSIDVKLSSVSGTLAIDAKKDEPLTVTLAKSGDSIQGRKTFRLSDAGYQYIQAHTNA